MTRSPVSAKLAALALAVAVHGAAAFSLAGPVPVTLEGASGTAELRLGTAFQDMAAGTLAAEPPATALNTAPHQTATVRQPAKVLPEKPDRQRALDSMAEPAAESRPAETLAALSPDIASRPAPKPAPLSAEASQAVAKPDRSKSRVTATDPASAAIDRSVRPKLRSSAMAKDRESKPNQPRQQAQSNPGNAATNARAGEVSGKQTATARQSGDTGRQRTAGNAAASNYAGLVMRQLSRAGKPRVNARGSAMIAFTIGGNGGVASVSVVQSSGSAALDQAALRLVRGAGPFPKPPGRARRSFTVQVKGR